jgi:hypothetical protein
VRDKKWDSVASYLDRKSVLYSGRGSLYLNVCVCMCVCSTLLVSIAGRYIVHLLYVFINILFECV